MQNWSQLIIGEVELPIRKSWNFASRPMFDRLHLFKVVVYFRFGRCYRIDPLLLKS